MLARRPTHDKAKKKAIRDAKNLARKEKKRLKNVNIYSPEFTGEASLHTWMSVDRIKAIGQILQDFRNTHRCSNPIADKDKSELTPVFDEMSLKQYKYFQTAIMMKDKELDTIKECVKECETLPINLRLELEKIEEEEESKHKPFCEEHDFHNLYFDQYKLIYPENVINAYLLRRRIKKIMYRELPEQE